MKHFLIITATFLLAACSKKDNPVPVSDTVLKIQISDQTTMAPATSILVKLYASPADYTNGTNTLAMQTTDATGTVRFTGLSNRQYYWYATNGCRDNSFTTNTTNVPIPSGTETGMISSIAATGTLKFVNSSTNPYEVFVNGTVVIPSQAAGSTYTWKQPAGAYSVRVLQLSGYALTPTDKTYTGALACGGVLTTTYP